MPKGKSDYHKMYGIPKTIFIFAHKVDIVFDEKLADRYNYNGLADYNQGIITLQPNCERFCRTPEAVKTTFWHETVHFVLRTLGYDKLTEDETFISLMSLALQQIIDMAKY